MTDSSVPFSEGREQPTARINAGSRNLGNRQNMMFIYYSLITEKTDRLDSCSVIITDDD